MVLNPFLERLDYLKMVDSSHLWLSILHVLDNLPTVFLDGIQVTAYMAVAISCDLLFSTGNWDRIVTFCLLPLNYKT